jgi:hypothetical protein
MNQQESWVPIFALGVSADWDDLANALQASVQYQSRVRNAFGPLFAFAPLLEPENPDAWEPLPAWPREVLLGSIARKEDARVVKAFAQVEDHIGPLLHNSTTSAVRIDEHRLIADVYDQMDAAEVTAFCRLGSHEDDLSLFFVRGAKAIEPLNAALGAIKR